MKVLIPNFKSFDKRWNRNAVCEKITEEKKNYCWIAPEGWEPEYSMAEVCCKCRIGQEKRKLKLLEKIK